MSHSQTHGIPWYQRVTLGAFLGAFFGVIELLPDFSASGFASAAGSGAIAFGTLGLVVPWLHGWPIAECIVCVLIGALTGFTLATFRASPTLFPAIYGAVVGGLLWTFELRERNH